jgi:UDPglucose 6-dehydrogenase
MKVNDRQKGIMTKKLNKHFKNDLAGKTIAVWGLSFKPDTDDIREAPALVVIDQLLAAGVQIRAFDPEAMKNVEMQYGNQIHFCNDLYEALAGADCLCIMTEWSEFRNPDFKKMKALLNEPVIFDGRNVYDLNEMKTQGFQYASIGRAKVKAKRRVAEMA